MGIEKKVPLHFVLYNEFTVQYTAAAYFYTCNPSLSVQCDLTVRLSNLEFFYTDIVAGSTFTQYYFVYDHTIPMSMPVFMWT